MPDIAMCRNQKCPSAHTCHRFMAIPSPHRQAYAEFKPEEGEDRCKHFLWHHSKAFFWHQSKPINTSRGDKTLKVRYHCTAYFRKGPPEKYFTMSPSCAASFAWGMIYTQEDIDCVLLEDTESGFCIWANWDDKLCNMEDWHTLWLCLEDNVPYHPKFEEEWD